MHSSILCNDLSSPSWVKFGYRYSKLKWWVHTTKGQNFHSVGTTIFCFVYQWCGHWTGSEQWHGTWAITHNSTSSKFLKAAMQPIRWQGGSSVWPTTCENWSSLILCIRGRDIEDRLCLKSRKDTALLIPGHGNEVFKHLRWLVRPG